MDKNNIRSFLKRYWLLIVGTVALATLALTESLFGVLGTLVYGPVLVFGAGLSVLAFIHVKFPNTLDADNHDGTFVAGWKSLTLKERVDRVLATSCALFLGACWIFAALVK